jgi:asparagine synthase (glutamine-hydrolysing)
MRRRLMNPDLVVGLNGHDPSRIIREAYQTAPSRDALSGMIAADLAMLLPDDFLVKVDRASMANGLEVRPPLLDHELLELAAGIPSEWKIHRGEAKWVLKEAPHPKYEFYRFRGLCRLGRSGPSTVPSPCPRR